MSNDIALTLEKENSFPLRIKKKIMTCGMTESEVPFGI
jgi:hypothetical protein